MELDSNLHNLPTSAGFIDQIINELASFQAEILSTAAELDPPRTQSTHQPKPPQNALSRLSPSQLARVKPLLLTLHCLFPNDLLPALDILDRRLVQRLVVRGDKSNAVPSASTQEDHQTVSSPENGQEIQHDGHESNTRMDQTTLDDTTPEDTLNKELFGFVFLVTSASSAPAYPIPATTLSTTTSTSTYTTNTQPQKVYEVRLNAWNCTCPTFTLSTFRDLESRLHSISKPKPTPRFSSPPPSKAAMLRDRDDGSAFASTSAPTPTSASAVYPFGGTLTCPTDRDSPPACKHILACVLFARCPGLFGNGDDDDDDRGVDVSMEELAGWCAGWGG